MAEMTVSFSKGKANESSKSHNNRSIEKDFDFDKKGHKHIIRELTPLNEVMVNRDIHDVFDEQFGEAVDEYNQKQKRKDRKIKDYYSKVKKDKKLRASYEFIAQIGNKDDYADVPLTERSTNEKWQNSKKILEKYVEGFQKRNPNLILYNASIHMDEEGSPHAHIDVVPVAHLPNAKRGLKVKPSFNQALAEQGFPISKQDNRKQFRDFQHREADAIAEIAREFDIERKSGFKNNLKDVHQYKQAMREIENEAEQTRRQKMDRLGDLDNEINEKQLELFKVNSDVDKKKRERDRLDDELKKQHERIEQQKEDQLLGQQVLDKQNKEIEHRKKTIEELKKKAELMWEKTFDRTKEVATTFYNSVKRHFEKKNQPEEMVSMAKDLSYDWTTNQLKAGEDPDMSVFEEAKWSNDEFDAMESGGEKAERDYEKSLEKPTTEPVSKKPVSQEKLNEQYKQYLQSQQEWE